MPWSSGCIEMLFTGLMFPITKIKLGDRGNPVCIHVFVLTLDYTTESVQPFRMNRETCFTYLQMMFGF